MRVTENTNFGAMRDAINRSKERMEGLRVQATTAKRISQPSDDPVASAKLLELRTDQMNNEQFQQNAKLAEVFLKNTDQALEELIEILNRTKEIAINQSNGPNTSEEARQGIAEEVGQLFQHAVSIANTRVGERYLFGGYKNQKPPVEGDGHYIGDNSQVMVEIANEVFISINLPGTEAFNTAPEGQNSYHPSDAPEEENINLFDEFEKFRISVVTGDLEGIQDTLDRLDKLHKTMVANRVKVGTRIHGIQSATESLQRHAVTSASLNSSLEDADMAQVVSDLSKEEAVFKNSLATSKRLIQPTLLDFLR